MQPVGSTIFVEEVKTKTDSQFELANTDKVKYQVTAIGEDVTSLKEGDFILFTNSQTFDYEGNTLITTDSEFVIGVDRA